MIAIASFRRNMNGDFVDFHKKMLKSKKLMLLFKSLKLKKFVVLEILERSSYYSRNERTVKL